MPAQADGDRKAAFERPLRALDDYPLPVRITQESAAASNGAPSGSELHVAMMAEAGRLGIEDQEHIRDQVRSLFLDSRHATRLEGGSSVVTMSVHRFGALHMLVSGRNTTQMARAAVRRWCGCCG
jgi:hypothetical protein